MYAAVRRWQVAPDSVEDVARRISEGFVPVVSGVPGFVAYHALDGGEGVIISVSVFEDRAGVEESTRLAGDWVRRNLGPAIPNLAWVSSGEVIAHQTK